MAYDMYQEVILQHYRAPRNFGALDHPDRPADRDRLLRLREDRDVLKAERCGLPGRERDAVPPNQQRDAQR